MPQEALSHALNRPAVVRREPQAQARPMVNCEDLEGCAHVR